MSQEKNIPSVSLGTLLMVIQVVESEISKLSEVCKDGTPSADDEVWLYDLDRAADNLEEVYKYRIDTEKIVNFPKYEDLVRRNKA
jgi:hypothetical protein